MSDRIQKPTPEQHEALHKIIDRLPKWSAQFEDHSECEQTITSLRSILESQGRISEQHRGRVQELVAENHQLREALGACVDVIEATLSGSQPTADLWESMASAVSKANAACAKPQPRD